ncbi:MAG: 3'-5' exonuclease [Bacteroidales bacterium]|nr:3'-5' exonuclease [Bacteroidales bacterium]MDD6772915.1 3'-5' exonuclease [Bacteroidales bacterium]
MELNLNRPLLFFDIESTGLSIPTDSIIELSFVKVFPGGESRIKTWKIKPWDYVNKCQKPINPEASKVNGVTDDMLTGCPRFFEVVEEVVDWLKDSDLAGFNSAKFDLPMLAEEIERVRKFVFPNINIDLHEPVMVDVQNIYHAMEPRNLKAAYRFYCGGGDFENAHTAEADTLATYEVLKAQLDHYDTLKNDVKALSAYAHKNLVDFSGMLVYNDKGEAVVNFGKHKGKTARQVFNTEPSYFAWIQQGSFTLDTKAQFARLEEEFKKEKLVEKFNGRLF